MKFSRRVTGRVSQKKGQVFEAMVFSCAQRLGFHPIKIPLGARQLPGNRLIRVKTDFDLILVSEKVIFLDLKCTKAQSFPLSCATPHQIDSLAECERRGHKAGYLVNFETTNQIVFFSSLLFRLAVRGSLKPEHGILIGSEGSFDLRKI